MLKWCYNRHLRVHVLGSGIAYVTKSGDRYVWQFETVSGRQEGRELTLKGAKAAAEQAMSA